MCSHFPLVQYWSSKGLTLNFLFHDRTSSFYCPDLFVTRSILERYPVHFLFYISNTYQLLSCWLQDRISLVITWHFWYTEWRSCLLTYYYVIETWTVFINFCLHNDSTVIPNNWSWIVLLCHFASDVSMMVTQSK